MIYIDLGCHNGDSIIDFYEGRFGYVVENQLEILSIGIDPLSNYDEKLKEICKKYPCTIIKGVVSDFNGLVKFSEHPTTDISSTIRQEKPYYDIGKMYDVEAIRLSDFIKDYEDVIIRMDIEGEEYNVLQDLINTGEIKRIKYIEIEFHAHRLKERHKAQFYKKGGDLCAKLDELKINYKLI
jgi:FkbM family methyltransferase